MPDETIDYMAMVDGVLAKERGEAQASEGESQDPPAETADGKLEPGKESQASAEKQPVVEDEFPELPENQAPHRDDWKRLREKAKEYKEKSRAMETELAALREQRSVAPERVAESPAVDAGRAEPNAPSRAKYPLDGVLNVLAKGMAGDMDESVFKAAKAELRKYSPRELRQSIERAEAGHFGSHSEDIGQMLRSEMPLAIAEESERQLADARRGEESRHFNGVVRETMERYPEMKDPNSDFSKDYRQIGERIVGKLGADGQVVERGMFPELAMNPNIVPALAYMAKLERDAKETGSLRQEVERLRELEKKYNKIIRPEDASRSAGNTTKGSSDDDILREIGAEFGLR